MSFSDDALDDSALDDSARDDDDARDDNASDDAAGAMIGVSVVVDDGHAADLAPVAETLRAHGMTVNSLLDEIGMITGYVPADGVSLLQTLDGVASVTPEHHVRLAPPDAEVQ